MKEFFIKHYKLSVFINLIILSIGCCALCVSELETAVALVFCSSLATLMRLATYKTGKIPIFMRDRTWNAMSRRYKDEDELDEKYAEMSINRATTYFMLNICSLAFWIICEIVCALVALLGNC